LVFEFEFLSYLTPPTLLDLIVKCVGK
jgi:hypothetical protein